MRHATTAWLLLGLIAELLRRFLGRPVSPQALLDQVRRIGASAARLSAAAPPGAS